MINSLTPDIDWQSDLRAVLSSHFEPIDRLSINALEAGGGSSTFLHTLDRRFVYTTIDISPEQIERNTYAAEKILGDIQAFDWRGRTFDAVVCWDVLEHVEDPCAAMERLSAAVASGGILIIKGPIPRSMKGLVTRLTPYWFHVLFYRVILGRRGAGTGGRAPFRTTMMPGAEPEALVATGRRHGLVVHAVRKFRGYQVAQLKAKSRILYAAFRLAGLAMHRLSGRRYEAHASDFFLVLRRAQDPVPT